MRLACSLVLAAGLAACAKAPAPPTVLSGGNGPDPAEVACISAVEGQTGRTGVTARATQSTGTETTVALDVPGAAAPWTCVADSQGKVMRVTYSGDGS